MHSASIEKSARLQRVHKVLSDGLKHTTRDLIRKARVCAVNSITLPNSEIMDSELSASALARNGLTGWRNE